MMEPVRGAVVREFLQVETRRRAATTARWLWRLLGFASTLVGFITFAIVPPFNKLIHCGLWGLLVILIYCALGTVISCIMLCSIPWRISKNAMLTSHVVFFVLMLTSTYSFFLDKTEKEQKGGKKVLNLISCGAFSLMSLSFSMLTGLGFEAGVFSFFLGSLTTVVMAWNWKFVFVAGLFCYVLIMIRAYADDMAGLIWSLDYYL